MKLSVLLNLIGIIVLLLAFGKMLTDFVVLLKQSQSLSAKLIGLPFNDDRDFSYVRVVELARVSSVQLFCFEQN